MEVSRRTTVDVLAGAELSLGLPGGEYGAQLEALRAGGKRGFSETTEVDLKLDLKAKESPPVEYPCTFSKDKIKSDPARPPAK